MYIHEGNLENKSCLFCSFILLQLGTFKIPNDVIYQSVHADLVVGVDSASSLKVSVGGSSAGGAVKRSRYHSSAQPNHPLKSYCVEITTH